jgi:hypothetical protein
MRRRLARFPVIFTRRAVRLLEGIVMEVEEQDWDDEHCNHGHLAWKIVDQDGMSILQGEGSPPGHFWTVCACFADRLLLPGLVPRRWPSGGMRAARESRMLL